MNDFGWQEGNPANDFIFVEEENTFYEIDSRCQLEKTRRKEKREFTGKNFIGRKQEIRKKSRPNGNCSFCGKLLCAILLCKLAT